LSILLISFILNNIDVSLTITDRGSSTEDSGPVTVDISFAEFEVIKSLCQFSIPYLLGWNLAFSAPKTMSASASPSSKSTGGDSYSYSEEKPRSSPPKRASESSPSTVTRKSPSPMWKQ
jgi:hypothetical protein